MIADVRNTFAYKVSVAAAAGTAAIGDTIDLGTVHRDIGNGKQLYCVIEVTTEIITGGAAGTVDFQLVSDSNSNLVTSPVIHYDTGTFVTGTAGSNAQLKAGSKLAIIALPWEGTAYKEFLGIRCITGTTTTTAGNITAFLTTEPASWAPYAQGVN